MRKRKIIVEIEDSGDMSVGINPTLVTITLEANHDIENDAWENIESNFDLFEEDVMQVADWLLWSGTPAEVVDIKLV